MEINMWDKIEDHIGKHCVFKLDGMIMSGFFCGIGESNGHYGMIFLSTAYNKDENRISTSSCILIHPLRIKCTLYSDMLSLRRSCRKLFRKLKLANHSSDIFYPSFEIKEITYEAAGIKASK